MKKLILLSLVSFAFCFANGQALLLQRPTKSDVWPAFSVQRIQWQFANVDNIKIEVSADTGRTWSVVQASYPASATFYDWTVINKPSDSCFIRISDVANPTVQSSNYPANPFRIPRPTLNIEDVETTVFGKTVLPISWSSTGTQNISLFITYDNFLTYQLIANNLPASKEFYNWTVKDTIASNAFIIIQSVNDISLIDTITQPLSIKKLPSATGAKYRGGSYDGHSSATNKVKSIRLLTPNTRIELAPNTVYPITWNSTSINQVSLKYSIDSGATWINITTSVSAASPSYNWTVPATPSNKCLVKITDTADAAIFDNSDTIFSISSTLLDLVTPVENEVVYKGQVLPISWTSAGIAKVNLAYLDGSTWKTIRDGVTAANEAFNWVVPAIISDSIKIRISDFDNPSKIDTVSKVYVKTSPAVSAAKYKGGSYDGHSSATNKGATIMLLKPNGNIQVASALPYTITWISSSIANVDLAFSADSGATWQNIVTNYANSQSYTWTVPGIASTRCLVRIRSTQDPATSDVSDSVFTILPKSIDLVVDTIATRYFGTAMPLEWTQQGIEKVSLNYKTSRNGSWLKIKDSITSTLEIYNWIITTLSTDSVCIKIFDYKDSVVKDEHLFSGVFKSLPAITSAKYKGGSFDGHSFRSTNNTINIYRPAANDSLLAGQSYAIGWRSGNVTDSITLQYSLDSGSTWTSITNVPAITEQYNWSVPTGTTSRGFNVLSNDCIVRALEMKSGNEVVGTSSRTFSILKSSPLPVNIISFAGKCEAEKAKLTWISENEINVNRYEVERSLNGVTYQKAGEVKATNVRSYSFIDASTNMTGKRVYYRLKVMDNDGNFKYSAVVAIQFPGNTRFTVYPNPAKTFVQIQMSSNLYGPLTIQLTDVSGKMVQQKTIEATGSNIRLNTGSLISGTYIIKITYKGEEHQQKIVIIK